MSKRGQKTLVAALALASCLAAGAVASAQARPAAGGGAAAAGGAAAGGGAAGGDNNAVQAVVRNEGGRRVYEAQTVIDVRGEIQRPYAFTLSGRSSLGYSYFEQAVSFVNLILDAVRRAPF